MSLFGKVTRSLESPNVPLTDVRVTEWIGGGRSAAGVTVTESTVFGLTAYYRAIALLSGTLACLPLKVYQRGSRKPVKLHTVLDSPNPRQTPFEFWQTVFANALGWGNGYAQKERDSSGAVVQVWSVHPSRVRSEPVDPTDDNPAGLIFHVRQRDGAERVLTGYELFRLPFLAPDGQTGLSPLRTAMQSLAIAQAAEKTSAAFYANGTMLSGVLTTDQPLNEEQATRTKARWREKVGRGPASAGEVAVLDRNLKFQALTIPPADAQLLQSRQFGVTEIARMFGLPNHLLNDITNSTSWGTGIEQQVLGMMKFTLNPWIELAEQRVTRELLPGGWDAGVWFAEYSMEGLLRGDSQARSAAYGRALQWGWMNRNEVRQLENLEPAEGLDEFLVPTFETTIAAQDLAEELAQLKLEIGANNAPDAAA